MNKRYSAKTFTIDPSIWIECWTEDTRTGFRHLGILHYGFERYQSKIVYYNRTWESFEYQSLIDKLADTASIPADAKAAIRDFTKTHRENSGLSTLAFVAALGDIFGKSQKESNDWKTRMIKAGLGDSLDIPPDWDSLSEDEKETRLNSIIAALRE